jgi:hypothetical protein
MGFLIEISTWRLAIQTEAFRGFPRPLSKYWDVALKLASAGFFHIFLNSSFLDLCVILRCVV